MIKMIKQKFCRHDWQVKGKAGSFIVYYCDKCDAEKADHENDKYEDMKEADKYIQSLFM